jgi:chitinase
MHHPLTVTRTEIRVLTEGSNEYTTCTGLLSKSSSTWPKTSLFEIAASGVPKDKLIIGKPATKGDATNGYISPTELAKCVSQAKAKGWKGGVMVWEVCIIPSYSLGAIFDNSLP